jgi:hypothetical protein
MKLKLSMLVVLLAGIAITYTACKKSGSNPSGPALAPKEVSSQIALNLAQTLYNGFGAFSINDGLNAPTTLGVVHRKGPLLNDLNDDPFCGLVVDTTLNYNVTSDGTSASVKGNIKFSFLCSNNVLSGFSINDNLAVTESTSQFSVAFQIGEDLTMVSLNPSNDDSNLSLNGSLSSSGTYNYKTGSKQSGTQVFDYTLKSLVIDPNGDILSGSATFDTKGNGSTGVWNYQGTIVFTGNYTAKITINGTAYTVNLQTGQVS